MDDFEIIDPPLPDYSDLKNTFDTEKPIHSYTHLQHFQTILDRYGRVPDKGSTEKLNETFTETQRSFVKQYPKEKNHFLCQSYVLHKLCEILEVDDLDKFAPNLQSYEDIKKQDQTWKKICKDLDWVFTPSL